MIFRFFYGRITASAPCRFAAATTASLSSALSAMAATARCPSINGPLGDIRLLATRQDELDRVAQGAVNQDVDLGAESAHGTAQRLIVVYPVSGTAAC